MTILHPSSGTAIFRPNEVRKLIHAIPKNENRERFEALLYSGCRYTELQEVHGKMDRIDGNSLKVKNTKALSKKMSKYRYVMLNNPGIRAIEYYIRSPKPLPNYVSWYDNLKRWCEKANIEPDGIGIKSTRKTWESYLVTIYPQLTERIFLSQGHTDLIALKHYLMIPFSKEDKEGMLYFVEGWNE